MRRLYSEGGSYYRPYDRNVGASKLWSNTSYTGGGGFEHDYGAAVFNTRFSSSISTFMPLVFDNSPSVINLAGYPKVVQGETNSYGMWWSTSDAWVNLLNNRILNYYADTSGGNSGGPVWVYSGGTRRIVAVHNNGALLWNGGARLVSQNQSLITGWMQWTPPALPAPTGMTASDGTYSDRVALVCNSVSGATHYRFYRSTSSGGTKSYLGATSSNYYNDTTATPRRTYYYWVKSSNSYGDSGYSSYNTGYRALSAPTGVSAGDGSYTDKVRVTWSSVSGATSYKVYRATSSGGTKSYLGATSSNYLSGRDFQ